MRTLAISDIHGNYRTFRKLLEDKIVLEQSDKLFLLGDYVHRGPNADGVIQYITKLQEKGFDIQCLLGNHEIMYMEEATIRKKRLKPFITTFFNSLVRYIEYDNYIFVHAGFNFKIPDPWIDERAMVWERDWYQQINYNWLGNKIIVHGHTPITKTEILQLLDNYDLQAIGIDNGCFRITYQPDYGSLCAVNLDSREAFFQDNIDMRRY